MIQPAKPLGSAREPAEDGQHKMSKMTEPSDYPVPHAEPSALVDLLARVEGAAAAEEWGLLHEARHALVKLSDETEAFHQRFVALLDAGGFESAALALCELVLPGWRPRLKNVGVRGHEWAAAVQYWRDESHSWGKTPALALIAALLRALEAQRAAG